MILSVNAAIPHSQTKNVLEFFLKLPKLAGKEAVTALGVTPPPVA